jgi:hypothetical protein
MPSCSQVLPLLLTLVFVAGAGFIGYQIYLSIAKIQAAAREKMDRKNVVFTKDGLKVGVKHVENEQYVDATQGWVVKTWNLASQEKAEERKQKRK